MFVSMTIPKMITMKNDHSDRKMTAAESFPTMPVFPTGAACCSSVRTLLSGIYDLVTWVAYTLRDQVNKPNLPFYDFFAHT
jgi:hypothetical protein